MNLLKDLKSYLCFLFIIILSQSSCTKESVKLDPVTILQDDEIIIQFKCEGDNIEFFIAAIGDLSDGTNRTFPDMDIYRVFIDYNNNELIDQGVDLMISPKFNDSICVVYLLDEIAVSRCNYFNDITGEINFSSTDNLQILHMNYRVSLPKSRVSEDNKSRIIVQVYDSEKGWKNYPSDPQKFSKSIEIEW